MLTSMLETCLDPVEREYTTQGHRLADYPTLNGLRDGVGRRYDAQGLLLEKVTYQQGHLHGPYTLFGPPSPPKFALPLTIQATLDQGHLTPELRQRLMSNGLALPLDYTVQVEAPGQEWTLIQAQPVGGVGLGQEIYTILKAADHLTVSAGRIVQTSDFVNGRLMAQVPYVAGQMMGTRLIFRQPAKPLVTDTVSETTLASLNTGQVDETVQDLIAKQGHPLAAYTQVKPLELGKSWQLFQTYYISMAPTWIVFEEIPSVLLFPTLKSALVENDMALVLQAFAHAGHPLSDQAQISLGVINDTSSWFIADECTLYLIVEPGTMTELQVFQARLSILPCELPAKKGVMRHIRKQIPGLSDQASIAELEINKQWYITQPDLADYYVLSLDAPQICAPNGQTRPNKAKTELNKRARDKDIGQVTMEGDTWRLTEQGRLTHLIPYPEREAKTGLTIYTPIFSLMPLDQGILTQASAKDQLSLVDIQHRFDQYNHPFVGHITVSDILPEKAWRVTIPSQTYTIHRRETTSSEPQISIFPTPFLLPANTGADSLLADLECGSLDRLSTQFVAAGLPLSTQASILTETPGIAWHIAQPTQDYTVRQKSNVLIIEDTPFTIPIEAQTALAQRNTDRIRRLFAATHHTLSVTDSVEITGDTAIGWQVRQPRLNQTYTIPASTHLFTVSELLFTLPPDSRLDLDANNINALRPLFALNVMPLTPEVTIQVLVPHQSWRIHQVGDSYQIRLTMLGLGVFTDACFDIAEPIDEAGLRQHQVDVFRTAFEKQGLTIASDARLNLEVENSLWLLHQSDAVYLIQKTVQPLFVYPMLFTLAYEIGQSNILHEAVLRQAFANNGHPLLDTARITPQDKEPCWRVVQPAVDYLVHHADDGLTVEQALFTLPLAHNRALNEGDLSPLQDSLATQGYPLAADASVSWLIPNQEWLISQPDRTFTIYQTKQNLIVTTGRLVRQTTFDSGNLMLDTSFHDGFVDGEVSLWQQPEQPLEPSFTDEAALATITPALLKAAFPTTLSTLPDKPDRWQQVSDQEWWVAHQGTTFSVLRQQNCLRLLPGRLNQMSIYQAGKRQGDTKLFDNGQLMQVVSFVADQPNGPSTTLSNGKKQTVVHFKNGVQNGPITTYDVQGKAIQTAYYREGQLNGLVTIYQNGRQQSNSTYKANKRDGPLTTYHPNGTRQMRAIYQQDLMVGAKCLYYANGALQMLSIYMIEVVEGQRVSRRYGLQLELDEGGNILALSSLMADQPQGIATRFGPNGDKTEETYYDESGLVLKQIMYKDNKISRETEINDGTLPNKHIRLTKNFYVDVTYVDGRLHGSCIIKHTEDARKPILESRFVHGKLIRFSQYDLFGNIETRGFRQYDKMVVKFAKGSSTMAFRRHD